MNVTINGHNLRISDALEDFTLQKINRLNRYLPNIMDVQVDLSKQSTKRGADLVIAQITLRHGRGAILRAEERLSIEDRDSLKAAINGAVDKMYKRIRRFKGKRRSKRVRERYSATPEELVIAEELPEDDFEEDTYAESFPEETEGQEEIVRRKDVAVTAMHEEEAIQQMELLGHDFFMFFNMDTNSINVLYRRENEGYGVLVPQVE